MFHSRDPILVEGLGTRGESSGGADRPFQGAFHQVKRLGRAGKRGQLDSVAVVPKRHSPVMARVSSRVHLI